MMCIFGSPKGGAFSQAKEHAMKITKDDAFTEIGHFHITFENGVVTSAGSQQLWRGFLESKGTCQKELKYVVGDDKKMRFWYEVWLRECP
jgi:hypothetical protein